MEDLLKHPYSCCQAQILNHLLVMVLDEYPWKIPYSSLKWTAGLSELSIHSLREEIQWNMFATNKVLQFLLYWLVSTEENGMEVSGWRLLLLFFPSLSVMLRILCWLLRGFGKVHVRITWAPCHTKIWNDYEIMLSQFISLEWPVPTFILHNNNSKEFFSCQHLLWLAKGQ